VAKFHHKLFGFFIFVGSRLGLKSYKFKKFLIRKRMGVR
jgi:hypothetical protein